MADNFHWRCFLFLEQELINTQYYVEFHENNKNAFSMQFRSIILQACAEIEKMFKLICGCDLAEKKNIKDFAKYFKSILPEFCDIPIGSYTYLKSLSPWQSWSKNPEESPEFWKAYNNIKHQGKFEQATLENAILSLAGLCILQLVWMQKDLGKFQINSFETPKLFDCVNDISLRAQISRLKFPK